MDLSRDRLMLELECTDRKDCSLVRDLLHMFTQRVNRWQFVAMVTGYYVNLSSHLLYICRTILVWGSICHKTLCFISQTPTERISVRYDNDGKRYPCSRPWKPIGLWDVEAPTFSRQSAHRYISRISLSRDRSVASSKVLERDCPGKFMMW
jgi:hypothetical protein